ncbi:uncharacterized protein LOC119018006 isoform X2 [Acanthopagrus latus]|uniref:uncharacterized protein LOC119018006 isoform X2 n=1 Tax=Acanthopagrus latus TaxID=8177 RepID=UPI00187C7007|nr:uncharacterized protein LOC119018006 isoform X2 [Acanthopagrus latus]
MRCPSLAPCPMPADLEGTTKTFLWTLRIPRTATQAGCGMRPSRDSKAMHCSLTRPVTLRLLRWLKSGLLWFLPGFPSCLVMLPSATTTLQLHQAHWTKASIQVNQQLAGHPEARIFQSLPELQESRLDLRRNIVACSNAKSSFRAPFIRPRSSRVSCSQRAPGAEEAQNEELGECTLQEEARRLSEEHSSDLQVEIDRPKTKQQDKRGAEKACINSSVERGYEGTAASSWSSTARWPYSTDRTQR